MTREPVVAIDLFAGPLPGGWDVAAVELGLDPLGIEWDDAACRVREAAGLRTLQADVSELDPLDFPCDLLIASPPCTAFSMAGKGEGRRAIKSLLVAVRLMGAGSLIDQAKLDDACSDQTAHLVLEPLRWALATRPTFIACEQVPSVLPLWEAMADALTERGYSTWTGLLTAEQYGVPQTRRRAFLIASLQGGVRQPSATHQRYIAPRRDLDHGSLFELPDRERLVAPEDRHLLPWISMADALGWGMTERHYPAIACSSTTGGPDKEKVGGSAARELIYFETADESRWRDGDEPGQQRANIPPHRRPAAMRTGNFTAVARDADGGRSRDGSVPYERATSEPSPTITGGGHHQWVFERPATTIAGDARVFPPGGHKANDGRDNDHMVGRSKDAIRVTEEEAACLQSFPIGYPWHKARTRSAAFRCIGNAVPPLMAEAVLRAVLR